MAETERALPRVLVEVATDSAAGARAAATAGAGRIELCSALGEGGLSPTPGVLQTLLTAVSIPVFAMLRPRSGDFLYDRDELDAVLRDAGHLGAAGAAGFVFGALRPDGELDRDAFAAVVRAVAPLPVTCHRAFDLCAEPMRAVQQLGELGVRRVLTSGQAAAAPAGRELLRDLVSAAPAGLTVMAGAGVRAANVAELVRDTGVREVHLSASAWQPSRMQFRRPSVPMGSAPPPDEYHRRTTDGREITAVVAATAHL